MKTTMKKTLPLTLVAALAAIASAKNSHMILLYPGDGRAMAMAEAVQALPFGAAAMNYNPAAPDMAGFRHDLSYMHTALFADLSVEQAVYGLSLPKVGTFGVNFRLLHYPAFKGTDINGNSVTLSGGEMLLGLGYSRKVMSSDAGALSVGLSAKFVQSTFNKDAVQSAAADLGLLYRLNLGGQGLYFGASLANAGAVIAKIGGADSTVPMDVSVGAAYEVLRIPQHQATIAAGGSFLQGTKAGVGVEYGYNDLVFVRVGYAYRPGYDMTGLVAGAGIKYGMAGSAIGVESLGIQKVDIRFDYTAVPYTTLGTSHLIALGFTVPVEGSSTAAAPQPAAERPKKAERQPAVESQPAEQQVPAAPKRQQQRKAEEEEEEEASY